MVVVLAVMYIGHLENCYAMWCTYVVLFEVRVIFLDAVVEDGDDHSSAGETLLPRR